ncbi:MAG: glycosyltransferase family 2 protein [Myxococcota bacterium]|nr:glycosyltransferase family 2 protein [Myxococcota bacterium]
MELGILVLPVVGVLGCLTCATLCALALVSQHCLERLEDEPLTEPPGGWPRVSVIIPACNEARTIAAAIGSLLKVDYPDLEIILVNDRSTDETGQIMHQLASADARIHVHHVSMLPEGWLGKLNALRCGTESATGQLLLFADADVHFGPSSIKHAVARMEREKLDHLTAMPKLVSHEFIYNATLCAFAIVYMVGVRAWRFRSPDSGAYAGVGAFAMVRQQVFDQTPGWAWLRMEIADDVGLGMLMVREAKGRSKLLVGTESIQIDWYSGLSALIAGLRKNSFGAVCRYSATKAGISIVGSLVLGISSPLLLCTLWIVPSPYFGWSVGVLIAAIGLQVSVADYFRRIGFRFIDAVCAPMGYVILSVILMRSTISTLRQGGIQWRTQFYSIDELKKGRRIDL